MLRSVPETGNIKTVNTFAQKSGNDIDPIPAPSPSIVEWINPVKWKIYF